jgi:hypothetical protein
MLPGSFFCHQIPGFTSWGVAHLTSNGEAKLNQKLKREVSFWYGVLRGFIKLQLCQAFLGSRVQSSVVLILAYDCLTAT